MTMRIKAVVVLATAGLLVAGSARAQSDHLKCYKIKDAAGRASYTANLNGLAPETGCIIKVPGKMLCVQTTKTAVSPAPPGGGPSGSAAGAFLCYKVKCPRGTLAAQPVTDQFGSRSVTPSTAKFLCAPATTPLTPASTTTTTPTLPLTTTTVSLPLTTTTGSLPLTTTTGSLPLTTTTGSLPLTTTTVSLPVTTTTGSLPLTTTTVSLPVTTTT